MIECTQCHIKYGSKLRQCPGCGHQRDLITDTPKKKITRSAYYQYIKSSWQHPFKTNWQWASGRFGWITIWNPITNQYGDNQPISGRLGTTD